ncbi:hypothetical protein [Streptomyces sp. H28]|nr:hypothetical protein [Streptomyces sp. H28]
MLRLRWCGGPEAGCFADEMERDTLTRATTNCPNKPVTITLAR